ncbi:MAG TPA: prepilin-type N-terminal cleavage/methylation domain-containing protein [Candidatus Paceibacterota bacterium]
MLHLKPRARTYSRMGFTPYHFSFLKSDKGFTLIELLVVIAIIGVLSSVVLASLNSARQKGRDARRVSDIKQLQLALELYHDANAKYPNLLNATNIVNPGYIATIPTDPTTGDPYEYAGLRSSGDVAVCASYHLATTLESADHIALDSDVDKDETDVICTGSNANFDGSDDANDMKFDVKP